MSFEHFTIEHIVSDVVPGQTSSVYTLIYFKKVNASNSKLLEALRRVDGFLACLSCLAAPQDDFEDLFTDAIV